MMLRDYQQAAHDAAIAWVRKSIDPCVLDLATGAGKSHIIAAIAKTLNGMTGKKILCLAPSAELVTQNTAKYKATGNPASIFSASAGGRCSRHPVVFGTPGTVKNKISRFGAEYCAVIVDECHGITPTIKHIIATMRECNPNLRVIGLSATPYRLGSGWIFKIDQNGKPVAETKEPYFMACVHKTGAHELIQRGFLTAPVIGEINSEKYDTLAMQLNSRGQFDSAAIDQAYHGHGRKTAHIIADVVRQSQNRNGVMIFAATVRHAQECLASLPPELSAIVTGDTPKAQRDNILKQFKAKKLKYLVNVSVLTTGFDAPHVDVIALLRATESVGLLQQIIGRGLRIDESKKDCLILDYAENLERHCPDGDVFSPEIKVFKSSGGSDLITAICPACNVENKFSARQNDAGFGIDDNGYFIDLDKNRIKTDFGDMPAHYGRRCMGHTLDKKTGENIRCWYRWTFKECPSCGHDNDIAARYCSECKNEIVDPNEKLRIDFKALKRDPTKLQTDEVLQMDVRPVITKSGKECLRVDYVTPYRAFSVWYHPYATSGKFFAEYKQFLTATKENKIQPVTITYRKNAETGFYTIHDYNRAHDELKT